MTSRRFVGCIAAACVLVSMAGCNRYKDDPPDAKPEAAAARGDANKTTASETDARRFAIVVTQTRLSDLRTTVVCKHDTNLTNGFLKSGDGPPLNVFLTVLDADLPTVKVKFTVWLNRPGETEAEMLVHVPIFTEEAVSARSKDGMLYVFTIVSTDEKYEEA